MSKICFIGCGNMAEAILKGIIEANLFSKADVLASDVNRERLSYIGLKFGVKTCLNDVSLIAQSDIIILSVKPQSLNDMMTVMKPVFKEKTLIISILAGVTIQNIEKYFADEKHKIVRVMPNMGAFVKKSVSAISVNSFIEEQDKKIVGQIFSSIGYIHTCKEKDIDLITAVSGSGPAYIFYFMEMFIKAAVNQGMQEEDAFSYCLETLDGAFNLIALKKLTPSQLREKVTSKKGTTEAAINVMVDQNLELIIQNAVKAAHERSIELGKQC